MKERSKIKIIRKFGKVKYTDPRTKLSSVKYSISSRSLHASLLRSRIQWSLIMFLGGFSFLCFSLKVLVPNCTLPFKRIKHTQHTCMYLLCPHLIPDKIDEVPAAYILPSFHTELTALMHLSICPPTRQYVGSSGNLTSEFYPWDQSREQIPTSIFNREKRFTQVYQGLQW